MKGFIKRFSVLAAVLVLAASCDSTVQEPLVEQQQPQFAVTGTQVLDMAGGIYTLSTFESSDASRIPAQFASAVIGSEGGTIEIGDYATLVVSDGAVRRPTTFTMTLSSSGFVEVELTATQTKGRSTVDVGSKGFDAPVTLRVNTGYVDNLIDPTRLTLLWEVDGTVWGRLQPIGSILLPGGWLSADLDHFSEYVMASN